MCGAGEFPPHIFSLDLLKDASMGCGAAAMRDVAAMGGVALLLLLDVVVLLDAVEGRADGVARLRSDKSPGGTGDDAPRDGSGGGGNRFRLELVVMLLVAGLYLRFGAGVCADLLRDCG
jgi:hypothetical protein